MNTDLQLKRPAEVVAFVETPTGPNTPPPMPPPSPSNVRISAFVLLVALAGASVSTRNAPDLVPVAGAGVFLALIVFLTCLARFNLASAR